jgi:superfamily II DNA/RNA helicase
MALLIGGVSMGDQQAALEKGVDVLIATPGRLMDLFQRGKILLNGCSLLVIDEADRMLDMGFIPDIEEICTKLPATRQTLLFSATMPAPIKKLADRFLSNPKQVEVSRPASQNMQIEQRLVETSSRDKKSTLRGLLRAEDMRTAIIFSNRKTTVRELAETLRRDGFSASQIHGDMEQAERIRELDRFKAGEINVLVASDVAARGLDIKGVSHVFNYDVPWHPDDYVHRIGRTGRAGATGKAFTLATPDDAEAVAAIEKLTGFPIPRMGAVPVADAPEAAIVDEGSAEAPRRGRGRRRGGEERAERPAKPEQANPEQTEFAPEPRREEPRRDEPRAERPRPEESSRPEPRRREEPRRDEQRRDEPRRGRRPEPEQPDDGWNGPMPSFLAFGFGTTGTPKPADD